MNAKLGILGSDAIPVRFYMHILCKREKRLESLRTLPQARFGSPVIGH